MAETTSMDAVLKLLQSFSGKGTTTTQSGGTSTTQTQLSQDTLNATLKSALEGNQGLAALAAGQNNTGMYNSTVNTQLSNDLLARLTTDATVAGAAKTTTTPGTTSAVSTPGSKNSMLAAVGLGYGKKYADKLLDGTLFSSGADASNVAGSGISAILEGHGGMDAAFSAAGNGVREAISSLGSDTASSFGGNILDNFISGGGSVAAPEAVADVASSAGSSVWDNISDWFNW